MSFRFRLGEAVTAAVLMLALGATASANDLRITINKRTKPTPVQKLNRDGVKALDKHDYKKAKLAFYKAYLLDPNDPFTLNNLGYVAELEGEVDRAQRYYALAAEQSSDALVDASTTPAVVGEPVTKVAGNAEEGRMQVNRLNVAAIGLLNKDRAPEADVLLRRALQLDPRNPFTLNNLGYAEEKQGEWEKALSYYTQAANLHSNQTVVVTANQDWRGKPISEIAARNASNLARAMRNSNSLQARVARLNLRGVSALNRNEPRQAREYFQQAYRLNPRDAFTLNNMGYVAEMDGDRETADFYYQKAAEAQRSEARVDIATKPQAEGQPLRRVAGESDQSVDRQMQAELDAKRRRGGPILLKRRDNTPVINNPAPPSTSAPAVAAPGPQATTPENAPPSQTAPPPPTQESPPPR